MPSQSSPRPTVFEDGQRPELTRAEELLRSIPPSSRSERVFVFAGTVAELRSTLAEISAAHTSIFGCRPAPLRASGAVDG